MAHDSSMENLDERARKRPRIAAVDTRPAYPRKRAAQACLACRRRRTKCDNEQPSCNGCSRLGIECVYRELDKSRYESRHSHKPGVISD